MLSLSSYGFVVLSSPCFLCQILPVNSSVLLFKQATANRQPHMLMCFPVANILNVFIILLPAFNYVGFNALKVVACKI